MNLAVCHSDLGNNVANYEFHLPLYVTGLAFVLLLSKIPITLGVRDIILKVVCFH
jgi:hypothetical protein